MKRLLIVWHSHTGGSEQMARAAADAARATVEDSTPTQAGLDVDDAGPDQVVAVRLLHAHDATADDVLAADGYIFVTPENLATMVGLMKDFFDRIYYAVLDKTNGRPYASLICAGSDGTGAARQIERIATGLRWKAIAPALIVITRAQTPEAILAPKTIHADDLARCAEIGAGLAAGLAAGVF